jgi:hypothetical protein
VATIHNVKTVLLVLPIALLLGGCGDSSPAQTTPQPPSDHPPEESIARPVPAVAVAGSAVRIRARRR